MTPTKIIQIVGGALAIATLVAMDAFDIELQQATVALLGAAAGGFLFKRPGDVELGERVAVTVSKEEAT